MTWGWDNKRRTDDARRTASMLEDPAHRVVDLECEGMSRQARESLEALRKNSPVDAKRAMRMARVSRLLREPVHVPDLSTSILERLEREESQACREDAPCTLASAARRNRRRMRVSPTLAAIVLGAVVTTALVAISSTRTRARHVTPRGPAAAAEVATSSADSPVPTAVPWKLTLGDTSLYDRYTPVPHRLVSLDAPLAGIDWPEFDSATKLVATRDRDSLLQWDVEPLQPIMLRAPQLDYQPALRSGLLRLPLNLHRLDAREHAVDQIQPR